MYINIGDSVCFETKSFFLVCAAITVHGPAWQHHVAAHRPTLQRRLRSSLYIGLSESFGYYRILSRVSDHSTLCPVTKVWGRVELRKADIFLPLHQRVD